MRGAAQRMRLLQDRIEHRGEIAGRGIDDAQHLSSRGLLLQGFVRLGDQSGVLYRDHSLRSEVLQERDLLVGKRPNIAAIYVQDPEQRPVLAQGHGKPAADAPQIEALLCARDFPIGFGFRARRECG
jgi:hypothetical protein